MERFSEASPDGESRDFRVARTRLAVEKVNKSSALDGEKLVMISACWLKVFGVRGGFRSRTLVNRSRGDQGWSWL